MVYSNLEGVEVQHAWRLGGSFVYIVSKSSQVNPWNWKHPMSYKYVHCQMNYENVNASQKC